MLETSKTIESAYDEERELMTFVFFSCEKYSDLWEANVTLLNKNWEARTCRTLLVTDKPTDKKLDRVEILVVEDDSYAKRFKGACENIKTKFILMSMDDYLITKPIDDKAIRERLHQVVVNDIDYLTLFYNFRHCGKHFPGVHDFRYLHLEYNHYQINLYPAFWKVASLAKTTETNLSPWLYEVSLTKNMADQGALCLACTKDIFPIMDTVRKGHFLHKPYRYLKKNKLYSGTRGVISYKEEWNIALRTFGTQIMPRWMFKWIKSIALKHGKHYFSGNE